MRNIKGMLVILLILCLVPLVEGGVPGQINFQGVLKDGTGTPVPDGSHSMTFTLYDSVSGGMALWTETQSITTENGLFTARLGSVVTIPDSVFAGPGRYLGIQIESDPEMTPREELVSVPYAMRVNSVDSALGGHIRTMLSIGPGTTNTGYSAFAVGDSNSAEGYYSTVSGGRHNQARGLDATIGGGNNNQTDPFSSGATIGGGVGNWAAGGNPSTVAGGYSNVASGTGAAIGGGGNNLADGEECVIAGGVQNQASARWSSVGGGFRNEAIHIGSTVTGGTDNVANGGNSTVCGGGGDTASGHFATVMGGFANTAAGRLSLAAGNQAKALHDGAFVWADDTPSDFASTAVRQFLIRASGGVGIGTNDPKGLVHAALTHDAPPTFVASWDARHFVVGGALNSGGLGFSYDQVNQRAYVMALSPNVLWRDIILQAGGGNVGIGTGTSAPAAKLHVVGTAGNATGVWSAVSDRRLKHEIEPLEHALEIVDQLKPVSFRWKDPAKDAQFGRVRGLIAQDVEEVLPEWVKTDADGTKRIEPIGVDALLLEAVKELKAQNDELRKELQELKAAVARLDPVGELDPKLGMK